MFRKISILGFLTLFFIALIFTARGNAVKSGNTFYIALNGSDSNPGTLAQPWATINQAAKLLKAGDTVYLRGGTYRITEQIRPKSSGSKNAWIVYASYPGEQAIIDASDVKVGPPVGTPPFPQDEGAFQVEKASYIRINNLKITNSYNGGFTINNSHHVELYNNTTDTTFSPGIAVWCHYKNGRGCEYNKIIGNTVTNANTFDRVIPGFPKDWEAPHEGISIGDSYYFEVAYNHVYESDKEGIDVKGSSRHGKVHHNYVHHVARQGLYVDDWGDSLEDIEVYENIVHDCKGAGFALSVENGQMAKDISVHHNLFYNNLGTGIFFSRWGGDGLRKNIKVYNNTVHHNGYGTPNPGETYYWMTGGLYLFSQNLQDLEITNNIFSDNQGFQIGYSDHYLKTNKDITATLRRKNINIEYNLIFDKNKVNYPIYVGWPPNNYANVFPFKGKHFVENAPLFTAPEAGNFYLTSNSPAINKGNPNRIYTDPDGTRNDIGAFFYGAKKFFWWKTNFPPHFNGGSSPQ